MSTTGIRGIFFDFVDDKGPQSVEKAAEVLFGTMMVADQRVVDETGNRRAALQEGRSAGWLRRMISTRRAHCNLLPNCKVSRGGQCE